MTIKSVNFLHYGDGLDRLSNVVNHVTGVYNKNDLIESLCRKHKISGFAVDLLKGYGGDYAKDISIEDLKQDVLQSLAYRNLFGQLNCRGFSYTVSTEFRFSHKLKPSINFRMALLSNKYLYYPPRLRRYLPRHHHNHIRELRFPSIAFALGRKSGDSLYIMVMQSDLFFKGPACIREYIQGWRKILFSEILRYCQKEINHIYLCTSMDVLKTCHPNFNIPKERPETWFHIYDKTAMNFNMELVELPKRINIQVLKILPPKYTNKMYHLKQST